MSASVSEVAEHDVVFDHKELLERQRRKTKEGKNACIDSIVTEARSMREPADVCANRRGSGEGWWRWWDVKKKRKEKKTIEAHSDLSFLPLLHQKIVGTLSRSNKSRFPSEFLSEKRHCVERRGWGAGGGA